MKGLRDNGWAFGLGLAILSVPVTMWSFGQWGSPLRPSSESTAEIGAIFGSLGMLLAGQAAYRGTCRSTFFVERVALLTMVSFGMAFLIASLPLILLFFYGAVVVWMIGVKTVGVPAFVLIAAWSALYLVVFGPKTVVLPQRSIVGIDKPTLIGIAAWSVLSICTFAASFFLPKP